MMRKTKIFLVMLAAFLFAITPAAMADTTSDTVEADHSDYGMDEWISDFDHNPEIPGYDGIQVEGDSAYGYYTGWNPGFNGEGINPLTGMTNTPLGAPSYTTPCPDFALLVEDDPFDLNVNPKRCEANTASDVPQTSPTDLADTTAWDIPILDDMLAKMWDFRSVNDRLTQQLDILFFLDPSGTFTGSTGATYEGFIDQTLDQDLADYQGNISSYVASNGIGHTQRLTQIFQTATTDLEKDMVGEKGINTEGNYDDTVDANFIDQWLLSYTKDIVGHGGPKKGIVSSYSQWFMLDKDKLELCSNGACEYTYDTEHDSITKKVPEINGHPNDDIPDP